MEGFYMLLEVLSDPSGLSTPGVPWSPGGTKRGERGRKRRGVKRVQDRQSGIQNCPEVKCVITLSKGDGRQSGIIISWVLTRNQGPKVKASARSRTAEHQL